MLTAKPYAPVRTIIGIVAVLLILPAIIPVQGALDPKEPGDSAPSVVAGPDSVGTRYQLFPRVGYEWPYATGPYYGDVEPSLRGTLGVVKLPVGTFMMSRGLPSIPQELKTTTRLKAGGWQYYVLQVDTRTGSAENLKATIERTGGEVVQWLRGALIARLSRASHVAVQSLVGLTVLEPYHPAFKLHPNIGRHPLPDPIKAASEVYELDVLLFPGEDHAAVAASIAALGGQVNTVSSSRVRLELHRSLLPDLARIEAVRMIFERQPLLPHGEETTTTVQAGGYNLGATPYHDGGVDGSGGGIDGSNGVGFPAEPQVLMIVDSGIQLDAGDLSHTRVMAGSPGPTHRKVRLYQPTNQFMGAGDDRGCDSAFNGAVTHGHVVAATALGNASSVSPGYGEPWLATDPYGATWHLDGVAPGAVLIAYDALVTPSATLCDDPQLDGLQVGNLYGGGPPGGSLQHGYDNGGGARIFNLSFGTGSSGDYDAQATDVDAFLDDKRDAMVFISVGNFGHQDQDGDGVPDPGTVASPAVAKNAVAVGASENADDPNDNPENRAHFSATGPAPGDRIAPLIMAPGFDPGTLGIVSEYACRTMDNDQDNPVECDVVIGQGGTSQSSAAAAGSALLVRDYFAQGFYPDGTSANTGNDADQVASVSGSLVKALFVASADFMEGLNTYAPERFNRFQGYGRVQLDNVLPLDTWAPSAAGLIVQDPENPSIPGIFLGAIRTDIVESRTETFEICDPTQELRVGLAWIEAEGEDLIHDLDLTIEGPTVGAQAGLTYWGNYYTDDTNRDGVADAGEDCPAINESVPNGEVDAGPWSLQACGNSRVSTTGDCSGSERDCLNPVEGIHLSPDPDGDGETLNGICSGGGADGEPCGNYGDCPDGTCEGGTSQIVAGTWTITVSSPGGSSSSMPQDFAIVISGGVCLGSSVRFDLPVYTCNGRAVITVAETPENSPTKVTAEDNTTVRVYSATDVLVDCEGPDCMPEKSNLTFREPSDAAPFHFVSEELLLTSDTQRDPGNGVLDVRSGDWLQVTYVDAAETRTGSAVVDCDPDIGGGRVAFAQLGLDAATLIRGGCERNARGQFEFGFPDRYMDAGELLAYKFVFRYEEPVDLEDAEASLRCVVADSDSPADCRPSSNHCGDPKRENNASCPHLTILDSPKHLGLIPAAAPMGATFSIQVEGDSAFAGDLTPTVELLLGVRARTTGKSVEGLAVSRHRLNVDELSLLYSTDFPHGGTEEVDWNNSESIDALASNVGQLYAHYGGTSTFPAEFGKVYEDYRVEQIEWADMTTGRDAMGNTVPRNTGLRSPWNFDGNDGGLQPIVARASNVVPLNNWDWNTLGGCGWQTKPPHVCSEDVDRGCFDHDDCLGTCQYTANPAASTHDPCGQGPCPNVLVCMNNHQPCTDQGDCPGSSCIQRPQNCVNDAGDCDTGSEASYGGIWHTGDIGSPTDPQCDDQCREYSTVPGNTGWGRSWELLVTPQLEKVNQQVDSHGVVAQAQILDWMWNQSVDLADANAGYTLEFDLDTTSGQPVDLFADTAVLQLNVGPYGVYNAHRGASYAGNPALTDGYSLFARVDTVGTLHGGVGGTRSGDNACYFEGHVDRTVLGWLGLSRPADDDLDNDRDGRENPMGRCSNDDSICYSTGECGSGTCRGRCANTAKSCNVGSETTDCISYPDNYCIPFSAFYDCDDGVNNDRDGTCETSSFPCKDNSECTGTCSLNPSVSCTSNPGECVGDCVGSFPNRSCSNSQLSCSSDAQCNYGSCDSCEGAKTDVDRCDRSVACIGSQCGGSGEFCTTDRDCYFCTISGAACPDNTCPDSDPECVSFSGPMEEHGVDELLRSEAGPLRNTGIEDWNGPDMRYLNLEDLQGPVGNTFQAAVGFINFEGLGSEAESGYGLGIDDMVIQWREFTLEADETDCAVNRACATLNLDVTGAYEGNTILGISLLESSPYAPNACKSDGRTFCAGSTDPACGADDRCGADNDCNQDGDYTDMGLCSSDPGRVCSPKECDGGENLGLGCSSDGDCPPNASCTDPVGCDTCQADSTVADDSDCDNDAVDDIAVRATSEAEPQGEVVILAPTGNQDEYTGSIKLTSKLDIPGTLYVAADGAWGPSANVRYQDLDDGTAEVCKNDVSSAKWGFVTDRAALDLSTCTMTLINAEIQDPPPGDDDGIPDTLELVGLSLEFFNTCDVPLHNCVVRVRPLDPTERLCDGGDNAGEPCIVDQDCPNGSCKLETKIGCMTRPEARLPVEVGVEESVTTSELVELVVGSVQRASTNQRLTASLGVSMECDEFESIEVPQVITFDLDLDIGGGSRAATRSSTFTEGFEGGSLASSSFEIMNLDEEFPEDISNPGAGQANAAAAGARCQYADPGMENSNCFTSGGDQYPICTYCFPGIDATHAATTWWTVDDALANPGIDRAATGNNSLYFGWFLDPSLGRTTPLAVVEAVKTRDPINLDFGAPPVLSWKQQVSLMDGRCLASPLGTSTDRAIVQVALADAGGEPAEPWKTLEPWVNGYDQQPYRFWTSCSFDPWDDGSVETDYFDPTDPHRRYGPSSTCFPQFAYAFCGDTEGPFDEKNVGFCDGPGEAGTGEGTWVTPMVDLTEYRGQRVHLRFLVSTTEAGTNKSWEEALGADGFNPVACDDGWWIDDIQVTNTQEDPFAWSVDLKVNSGECPATNCNLVTPMVELDPGSILSAPGQRIGISAAGSMADQCVDGLLEYQFAADGKVLRSFTTNPVYTDAPVRDTTYQVTVHCSSDPSCEATVDVPIAVDCPASGNLVGGLFSAEMCAQDRETFVFGCDVPQPQGPFTAFRGPLSGVATYSGGLIGSADGGVVFADPALPDPGEGLFYVMRNGRYCNDRGSWSSGGQGEVPGRDDSMP